MKHQTIDELQAVAEIQPGLPRTLTRSERLQRWAELLERDPGRRLSTLHQTEYQAPLARDRMSSEGSPISVAFADDVLREAGMKNDTYGEAKRFFELTDGQLHEVICYCHFGSSVSAATAAAHVRQILVGRKPGLLARLREAFLG
ncbi:hypothetical protein [Arvimicrobium flavum]|uniref:hypothetical protein n=1 Tax=Arvimicrobium flavum TaxID=3393320 RepID=UPI00237AF8CB|nr:hypothetical protein [Mesorhizobium shangrilense]